MARLGPRWLAPVLVLLVLLAGAGVYLWPGLVRHVFLSRVEAVARRPASVETVTLNPFTGRLAIRGLRIADRANDAGLAQIERVDIHVRPLALLGGHVWLREAVIDGATVRLVRFADGFNVSDLLEPSTPAGRPLDVTVDRLVMTRGTVVLEDRALVEPRTWTSEQMEIDAHNLSTRRDDGTAVARSITAGAPVSLEMRRVRLHPIHLEAVVTTSGLDVSLAQVYLPPGAIAIDRGRASSTVTVTLDAREGMRADVTGRVEDLVLLTPRAAEPAAVVPALDLRVADFVYQDARVAVGALEVAGAASLRDPRGPGRPRHATTVRGTLADVTWPITTAGRVDVEGSIPGGGTLRLTGRLRPPPDASQLRLRVARADLAPWAELIPTAARVTGIAEADLRVDEPLAPAVPAHVGGVVAVSQLSVRDGSREVAGAQRVEARDLEVEWPVRLAARQVVVTGPRATLERDAQGRFPALDLLAARPPDARSPATSPAPAAGAGTPPVTASGSPAGAPSLAAGEVIVRDGALRWRDAAVRPRVAADVTGIDARVRGAAWPLPAALHVEARLRPPGGGHAEVAGRVGLRPVGADLRVRTRDAELAPYQPYLPVAARLAGRADLDLAVAVPVLDEGRGTVRGQAAVSRLDVRDGERTVARVERAAAGGVDVAWPGRASVRELHLTRPWILLERDHAGALPLRALVTPRRPAPASAPAGPVAAAGGTASADGGPPAPAVTIARIVVEDGGARLVDQRVVPAFAVDMQRLGARVDGLSTDPAARPARLELAGRVAATSELELRGTLGSLGGPTRLDVTGALRGFAMPRANPYLIHNVAWEARQGWLTTAIRCRIDGEALDARTEIQLSRLELARAAGRDEAQSRIGLPLGMIVSLMKDAQGDIRVAVPVGGKINDPRFDVREAVWGAVRGIAMKAVAAPVSWIGRVDYGADARIERIEVHPVPFPAGTAALTTDALEQVSRVAAFLEQAPDVRMGLAAVVTARDREALASGAPQRAVVPAAAVEPRAGASDGPEPAPLPPGRRGRPGDATDLAERRLEAVRDAIARAGIDRDRLIAAPPASVDGGGGHVKLSLLEAEAPRPGRSNPLRRLLGAATEARD